MPIDLIFIFAGILAGVIAGMVPGVGMAVTMIAAYPILMNYEVYQIIQFYLSAIY